MVPMVSLILDELAGTVAWDVILKNIPRSDFQTQIPELRVCSGGAAVAQGEGGARSS